MSLAVSGLEAPVVVSPYASAGITLFVVAFGTLVLVALVTLAFVHWRREEHAARAEAEAVLRDEPPGPPREGRGAAFWQTRTFLATTLLLVSQTVFATTYYPLVLSGECVLATATQVHVWPYYYFDTRSRSRSRLPILRSPAPNTVSKVEMMADLEGDVTSRCDGGPLPDGRKWTVADHAVNADDNRFEAGATVPFVVARWRPSLHLFGTHVGMRPKPLVTFVAVVLLAALLFVADFGQIRRWLNRVLAR